MPRARTDEVPQATEDRHTLIERREHTWYREPAREALLQELEHLATDPARHRTRSIAIVAESNGGKTALVSRYLALHPVREEEERRVVPALHLSMTDIPRVEDLSIRLLEGLGALEPRHGNHSDRLQRFVKLARSVDLGLVFLDEFHDCADTTGRGKPFLRCIKGLLIEGVRVVPVGTESLAAVLAMDPQLASRFNFARGRLTRVTDPGVVKALMARIAGAAPEAVTDASVEFVLQETRGIFGHLLDLVEQTLLDHGTLSLENLRRVRGLMDVLDGVV